MACPAGPRGEAPGAVRRQREGADVTESLLWFLWEKQARQGRQA